MQTGEAPSPLSGRGSQTTAGQSSSPREVDMQVGQRVAFLINDKGGRKRVLGIVKKANKRSVLVEYNKKIISRKIDRDQVK